jgi:hypothetical protein
MTQEELSKQHHVLMALKQIPTDRLLDIFPHLNREYSQCNRDGKFIIRGRMIDILVSAVLRSPVV